MHMTTSAHYAWLKISLTLRNVNNSRYVLFINNKLLVDIKLNSEDNIPIEEVASSWDDQLLDTDRSEDELGIELYKNCELK